MAQQTLNISLEELISSETKTIQMLTIAKIFENGYLFQRQLFEVTREKVAQSSRDILQAQAQGGENKHRIKPKQRTRPEKLTEVLLSPYPMPGVTIRFYLLLSFAAQLSSFPMALRRYQSHCVKRSFKICFLTYPCAYLETIFS